MIATAPRVVRVIEQPENCPALPLLGEEKLVLYGTHDGAALSTTAVGDRDKERVVIPGFANLREFSTEKPKLLQQECGGAWRSYIQRGHWRMMLGFTGGHQAREAKKLAASIRANRPPVVHIVKFPRLTINHALLLFGVEETENEIRFATYDPYEPNVPQTLTFDRATREFSFPRNPYFIGGKVDIYEIYRAWNY